MTYELGKIRLGYIYLSQSCFISYHNISSYFALILRRLIYSPTLYESIEK